MSDSTIELAGLLGEDADAVAAGTVMQQIARVDATEAVAEWMESLWKHAEALAATDPAILGGLFRAIHTAVLRSPEPAETMRRVSPTMIHAIDAALPVATPNRHLLMHLLTIARAGDHLHVLARMLVDHPPEGWMAVGQILSPLMQYDQWVVEDFFPDVLEGLKHPAVAAPVLDLANFLTRGGRVPRHPAESRLEMLLPLFSGVIARLEAFERDPSVFGQSVEQVQAVLDEAIALAVSLCDAFGLIGDQRCRGKLHEALEIKHRRVQCEAAGALARLRDEAGIERLLSLAAEPSARRRVLQYADELDLSDRVDEAYQSEESLAESDLAMWLTQPQNMAVPPTEIEVIDRRQQYWPGYDQPIDCFLVRFVYDMGTTRFENVGITGPITHAFAADLVGLAIDDLYAIYAGWQAEHPEIFAVTAGDWNAAQKRIVEPMVQHLEREGFERIEPELLGFLLDETAIVCAARRHDAACVVVTDGLETLTQPTQGRRRPLTAGDMWNLFKGRKMLRSFN